MFPILTVSSDIDRRLQCKQHKRALLGAGTQIRDLLVVGDDLFGEHQIGLQQRLRRTFGELFASLASNVVSPRFWPQMWRGIRG